MSDSLWPDGLQHAGLLCPSLSPGVCSNSCPLSRGCFLIIHPLASPSFPIFSLSQHQGLFQWVNPSIRWPKYWSLSFSFSFSPFSEYLGFISFRMDWFDLLAVQGTLKSLLQHRNLKTSVLWHLAFFVVQFSHLYMTTGKISYTLILKNRME